MMILCDNCLRGKGNLTRANLSLCDLCYEAFSEGDMEKFHARFTRERTLFFFRKVGEGITTKDDSPIGEEGA